MATVNEIQIKNIESSKEQRISNITYATAGIGLIGSIVGVIYSSRTGGGFWRGVGYFILGSLVFGTPAKIGSTIFVNKIIKESDKEIARLQIEDAK